MVSEAKRSRITEQVRQVLDAHGGTAEYGTVIEECDYPRWEVMGTIRHLISAGKVSNTLDYRLSGEGKVYTEGFTEGNDG